jgi:hypothetical protein
MGWLKNCMQGSRSDLTEALSQDLPQGTRRIDEDVGTGESAFWPSFEQSTYQIQVHSVTSRTTYSVTIYSSKGAISSNFFPWFCMQHFLLSTWVTCTAQHDKWLRREVTNKLFNKVVFITIAIHFTVDAWSVAFAREHKLRVQYKSLSILVVPMQNVTHVMLVALNRRRKSRQKTLLLGFKCLVFTVPLHGLSSTDPRFIWVQNVLTFFPNFPERCQDTTPSLSAKMAWLFSKPNFF